MKASAVVVDGKGACANIRRFEKELGAHRELAGIMSYGRAWYACKSDGRWHMGPSKFVGYSENDAKAYLSTHHNRDGRITERVLAQWFEEVEPRTAMYDELQSVLRQLFARFGKKPNKALRISVLKSDLDSAHADRPRNRPKEQASRVTVDPEVCGGRPCIRGMRIRVSDVLDLLAAGNDRSVILADYPYLESEDIDAALAFASDSVNHRVVRAA